MRHGRWRWEKKEKKAWTAGYEKKETETVTEKKEEKETKTEAETRGDEGEEDSDGEERE